jgi:hypothetical protein
VWKEAFLRVGGDAAFAAARTAAALAGMAEMLPTGGNKSRCKSGNHAE